MPGDKVNVDLSKVECDSKLIEALKPIYVYAKKFDESDTFSSLIDDNQMPITSYEFQELDGKIICITVGDLRKIISAVEAECDK